MDESYLSIAMHQPYYDNLSDQQEVLNQVETM